MEECIESIFGCLERIENKINGLSVPLPEGNSPTVNNKQDESVLNEVRNGHETFRKLLARVYEGLAAIKNDMVSIDRKNLSQERLGQVLSEMRNEQRQNQEKVENLFCETNDTIRKNAVKTSNINHHFSLSLESPYKQHQPSFQPELGIPVYPWEFFRNVRGNRGPVRGSLFFGENR